MTACPDWVGQLPAPEDDPRFVAWTELYDLFCRANDDERAVILRVARQCAGKGRECYGALNLATDKRDMPREALAEVADALFYVAVALERAPKP